MDVTNKTILITGGAGFIGSHLGDALIGQGAKVVVIDDLSSGVRENVNGAAVFYELNVADAGIKDIFAKEQPEIVYHLASNTNVPRSIEDPLYDFKALEGALNVMDNCRRGRVQRFVFTSSGFIYGNTSQRPIAEDEPFRPISPYAITKKSAEQYLQFYNTVYGLSSVVVRMATVYGPRQIKGAMPDYINKLSQGKQAEFYGDGSKTRDYVYIEDIINVLLGVLDLRSDYPDPVFNIGSGKETTLRDLYTRIAAHLNKSPDPIILPDRPGELNGYSLDSRKAREALHWEMRHSLDDGLKKTLAWRKLI
ncbi:MAG: NAD-dependent epimerase/dehydratase family protein [Nitrospirota bacterium]